MSKVKVAAVQMQMTENRTDNIDKAEKSVRRAAEQGAKIILLPELFESLYFCQEKNYDYYALATTVEENPAVLRMAKLAKELDAVIPVSFFEKSGNTTFNTVAMIDADGTVMGIYRKTHIPDDHFYQEKFYFSPGDTGFKVWKTKYGSVGVGICWDQWFPETARCMALNGADILLYPTAIGSEPILEVDSMPHWRRTMQGHAAANIVPVVAANRIGEEKVVPSEANNSQSSSLCFYGSSFITDSLGEVIASASRDNEEVLTAEFDFDEIRTQRLSWGLFRDRRPLYYKDITEKM